MSELDLYAFNAAGDLETLLGLFGSGISKPKFDTRKLQYTMKYDSDEFQSPYPELDCSGFVRVPDDNSDLFFGHTTWTRTYLRDVVNVNQTTTACIAS